MHGSQGRECEGSIFWEFGESLKHHCLAAQDGERWERCDESNDMRIGRIEGARVSYELERSDIGEVVCRENRKDVRDNDGL